MASNITFLDATIAPNPVEAGGELRLTVGIEYTEPSIMEFLFVGGWVGSFVNQGRSEVTGRLPLAYVGDYVRGGDGD